MARPLRYTIILVLVAVGTALAALSGWHYARASAPVNGPIVLLSLEGIRADRLPAYGYRGDLRTPAISALAADGVTFDRAYAASPQTLPSHVSMLSGRYPFANGVRDQVGFAVRKSERLVQEILAARGYDTAAVVTSPLLGKETGLEQGFARYETVPAAPQAAPPDLVAAASNATASNAADLDAAARSVERWLSASGNGRAFLFFEADAAAGSATYDERVLRADAVVARLVRYLKTHQLYDRSTLIVTSDHGEGLGDHGEIGHGLLLHEEALRVPLLIKLPAGEDAGRRVAQPVQLADLAPTILEFAKAPVPGSLHGIALQPMLAGASAPEGRTIFSESLYGLYRFSWPPLVSATDGRYRYIRGDGEQLFDLKADSRSENNIAAEHRDVVASFRRAIDKLSVAAPSADAPVPAPIREQQEAAGYVGFRRPGEPLRSRPPHVEDSADRDTWGERVALVEQYRDAVRAASERDWTAALERFRALTREHPDVADLWMHTASVARAAERYEAAADAFRHAAELEPGSADAQLGAGWALFRLRRLDEAREFADAVVDSGAASEIGGDAHELLARIALARRDAERAKEEAALAEKDDPARPMRAFVEGRLAYDAGHYLAAAEAFDTALAASEHSQRAPIADLRYYAADTLMRVDRYGEAEYLLQQELASSPGGSARVRSSLAALFRLTGRAAEASALAH